MAVASLCAAALFAVTGCDSGGNPFHTSPSSAPTGAAESWRALTPGQALRFRPVLLAVPADTPASALEARGIPAAAAAAFRKVTCAPGHPDPASGPDDAAETLTTCDRTGRTKYLLDPVPSDGTTVLDGSAISGARADRAPTGTGYVVDVTFSRAAAETWATYTAAHVGDQIAIVLDSTVVSAPTIQQAILGGQTQISGGFSQQEAQDLAAWLNGQH